MRNASAVWGSKNTSLSTIQTRYILMFPDILALAEGFRLPFYFVQSAFRPSPLWMARALDGPIWMEERWKVDSVGGRVSDVVEALGVFSKWSKFPVSE